MKQLLIICFSVFLLSCAGSEDKTTSTEKVEIERMDSTSAQMEEVTEDLESQTEKVEESLEKLDDN